MEFDGFKQNDFDTFTIDGLGPRMEAVQTRLQPKFREIGSYLTDYLSVHLGNEMYLHIAKHLRRTVNPPKDTWLAIVDNKRGYKKHPHFQVGLFDDRVFIWLAYIYELPNKKLIAEKFITNMDVIKSLSDDFVISLDHTKKDSLSIKDIDLEESLIRFRDVKKAEFLIGKHIEAGNPILQDGNTFTNYVIATFEALLPIYKL